MKHVIDVRGAGGESVLTETGSSGLIGRALLAEDPLASYVEDVETPRYVLRNKKGGVRVDGPDGERSVTPDGDHCGLALVTDYRVLFAVGGAASAESGDVPGGATDSGTVESTGRDWALSVPLAAVADVRVESGGLLGDTFVVETATDARFEFPCRGNLAQVREFTDAAAGVWARADRRLERAAEAVERMERAFESGDVDVVLAAVGEVEETLEAAREAADSLEAVAPVVDDRAASVRADLAALERRAHAERAESARERGHTRWDDDEYERAYEHFETALESYEQALSIEGPEPSDALIERRGERLREERERLAASPLNQADHAAGVASEADDPETAAEWWETAVERYETLLSLDWGRDQRRFDGDREVVREALADAARGLVDAHCDRAREALDAADELAAEDEEDAAEDSPAEAAEGPDATEDSPVEAAEAPDEAEEADEGAPAADEEADVGPDEAEEGEPDAADSDGQSGGRWVQTGVDDQDLSDGWIQKEVDAGGRSSGEGDDGGPGVESVAVALERAEAALEAARGVARERVPSATDEVEAVAERLGERRAELGASGDAEVVGDGSAVAVEPGGDGGTAVGGDSTDDGSRPVRGGRSVDGSASSRSPDADSGASSAGDDGDTGGAGQWQFDPAAIDADVFPTLVAELFGAYGWSTTVFGSSRDRQYDVLAETANPVSITVSVWTAHPTETEAVDAALIERYAAYRDRADEADAAAVVSAAPMSSTARERAEEYGVDVLDADGLVDALAACDLTLADVVDAM